MGMVYHPDEFFIDDTYYCKLCEYFTESEEEFVSHILDEHEAEARRSNAVSISISDPGGEYWEVDSIRLAEEFHVNERG